MSGVVSLDSIGAPSGGAITASSDVYSPGMVIQAATVRTDARNTYSVSNSGDGTTVTDLNLTITPKYSSSLLIIQWMINGESHHDTSWLIHKDGSLITTSGYEGYNSQGGNNRWSGVLISKYDNNYNSTPSNLFFQFAYPAFNTTSQTFAPAVRSSSSGTTTLYLNRTVASAGADYYENTVSSGIIWEVAQ